MIRNSIYIDAYVLPGLANGCWHKLNPVSLGHVSTGISILIFYQVQENIPEFYCIQYFPWLNSRIKKTVFLEVKTSRSECLSTGDTHSYCYVIASKSFQKSKLGSVCFTCKDIYSYNNPKFVVITVIPIKYKSFYSRLLTYDIFSYFW